ncbi:MAG: hypothetical protein ACOCUV_02320, partial [bacterium]
MNVYHIPSWDESVFLGMGKWLSSSGKVGLWEEIRPPGLPIVLSLVEKTSLNYVIMADFLLMAFTLGILTLTYLISFRLFDKNTALIATILTFITPIIFHYSGRILTGIPALFFCLLALYFFLRKDYTLASISCWSAFIFRYPAGLIYPIIGLLILTLYYNKGYKNLWKNIKKEPAPLLKFNLTFILLTTALLATNKLFYGSFLQPIIFAAQHQSTFAGNIHGASYVLFYPLVLVSSNLFFLFAV